MLQKKIKVPNSQKTRLRQNHDITIYSIHGGSLLI